MVSRLWVLYEPLLILVPSDLKRSSMATVFPAFLTYCSTEEALNQDPWTEPDTSVACMPMGPDQARAAKALQQSCHSEAVGGREVRGYAKWISPGSLTAVTPLLIRECGTHTGSRVWEGALVQLQWAFQNLDIFAGRSVLELGAGCGLLGLAIAKSAGPREIVMSEFQGHFVDDSAPSLLDLLLENMHANLGSIDGGALSVWDLDWTKPQEATCRWPFQEELQEGQCKKRQRADGTKTTTSAKKFDVIIGSELIYSIEGAAQLLGVLSSFLEEDGACYLLNNIRRSGVSELISGCADVQLVCEQISFDKPSADSIMYTLGDNELSNLFILLKITRSKHGALPFRIPPFVESGFAVTSEYNAWVTSFSLVELNARLRREADSGMVAAARAVAAEKKEQPPLPPLP